MLVSLVLTALLFLIPSAVAAQSLPIQHVLICPIVNPDCVAYSPDGNLVAVGGTAGVKIYTAATGATISLPEIGGGTIYSVSFSPNSRILAASGFIDNNSSCGTELFDVDSGKLIETINVQSESGPAFAFSPDGSKFAVGGQNSSGGFLQIWNAVTDKLEKSLRTAFWQVNSICFSSDGRSLADSGDASSSVGIEVWDLGSDKLVSTVANAGGLSMHFSGDGTAIIVATDNGTSGVVEQWDVSTGKLTSSFSTTEFLIAGCFSADGKTLACCRTANISRSS